MTPSDDDLRRDLAADLATAAVTFDQLWAWGECEECTYVKTALAAWPAAIRRALYAEAELARLKGGQT
jgi:hypothetical protein